MKLINNILFYVNNSVTYPPFKNGYYLEEYFFEYMKTNNIDKNSEGRKYIPALWTNFQIEGWFTSKKVEMQLSLDEYIKENPSENGYFTVVQYDDGPLLRLPEGTIIYGACSGTIPLPLIYEDRNNTLVKLNSRKFEYIEKELLCSFVGTITHNVREFCKNILSGREGFTMHIRNGWSTDVNEDLQKIFVDNTIKSKFALAPRGYGRSSFRFFEIFQLGSVPVYVWDDIEWLPYKDKIDYKKICVSIHISEINNLESILKGITEKEYNEMIAEYERIKHMFGLNEMCKYIVGQGSCYALSLTAPGVKRPLLLVVEPLRGSDPTTNLVGGVLQPCNLRLLRAAEDKFGPPPVKISLCITTMDRFEKFLSKNLDKYLDYLIDDLIDEIIICDENGNDYKQINEKYENLMKTMPNFRVYKNKEILGVFKNKLKVCSYAKNNYIALIDSDNFPDKTYFETAKKYIENNEDKMSINVILSPSYAKTLSLSPFLNYKELENKVLTKSNINLYLRNNKLLVLLNTGNYIISKTITDNINYDNNIMEIISGCDVVYFNLLAFLQFPDLELRVVEGLEYSHYESDNGEYHRRDPRCDYFKEQIIMPEYYRLC